MKQEDKINVSAYYIPGWSNRKKKNPFLPSSTFLYLIISFPKLLMRNYTKSDPHFLSTDTPSVIENIL